MHKAFHRPFKAWLYNLPFWNGLQTVDMLKLQLWEVKSEYSGAYNAGLPSCAEVSRERRSIRIDVLLPNLFERDTIACCTVTGSSFGVRMEVLPLMVFIRMLLLV